MSFKPRILVIRLLALGDVILATPIIRQLYRDYSGDCEIDVLTLKPEVFTNNPYVAQVLSPQDHATNPKIYQKVVNLDLAYENYPNLHITEAYAKVSHGSIDHLDSARPELHASRDDIEYIDRITQHEIVNEFAVIHMRLDTWPSRNLPKETWLDIANKLIESTDLSIVQIGSPHEISFDHHPRLINMLGRFSIQQLKCLIGKARLYIGIDSGTLHVASCTNTPIVSIFTSAHHHYRLPRGRSNDCVFVPITPKLSCYGCQSRLPPPITGVVCTEGNPYSPPCKDAIDTGEVLRATQGILSSVHL